MNTHLTAIARGVELDVTTELGSWSLRLSEQVGGALALILADHVAGRVVLAELLERDPS